MRVVALGEPLVQLNAVTPGPLRYVTHFERHVAGSELNFCVSILMTGVDCSLLARVGRDEFGRSILEYARARGVEVSSVKEDDAPTGVYFIQRHFPVPDRSEVFYYRRGSAGSRLFPEDVNEALIKGARLVHSTGITLAISDSAREAVERAFQLASNRSVDTNIRPKLWAPDKAREALRRVIGGLEFLFVDPVDSKIIIGESEPDAAVRKFTEEFSVQTVVFKMGERGARVYMDGKQVHGPTFRVRVEDPIGAGDALAGYFVGLVIQGKSVEEAIRYASAAATLVLTTRGDTEALPTLAEASKFLSSFKGT